MEQHRQSFAIGETAMPLMETPEQQEIIELKEKLELNQKELDKTKSQLQIAEIKRASEVEGFKNAIQCLVLHNQTSSKNYFESENESKIQMMKMEFDKKFDDLKEQISKGQMQEELQKLRSENARLREELSNSITESKKLKECIKEFGKTNVRKDETIQELEETIRQKECGFNELKKELSDVVDKFEMKNLRYEELKKKYEEVDMKLDGLVKLQKATEGLELKHSQLQLQYQQQKQELKEQLPQLQHQLDKIAENNQISNEDLLYSKQLKECVDVAKKYLHALYNKETKKTDELCHECRRCYHSLSDDDQKKFKEVAHKMSDEMRKNYGQ